MRTEAMDRLNAVTARLLGEHGIEPSQYTGLDKDPELAQIRMVEAVAGDLEKLDKADATQEMDVRADLEGMKSRLERLGYAGNGTNGEPYSVANAVADIHARIGSLEEAAAKGKYPPYTPEEPETPEESEKDKPAEKDKAPA
jgi:hypothetical protein